MVKKESILSATLYEEAIKLEIHLYAGSRMTNRKNITKNFFLMMASLHSRIFSGRKPNGHL